MTSTFCPQHDELMTKLDKISAQLNKLNGALTGFNGGGLVAEVTKNTKYIEHHEETISRMTGAKRVIREGITILLSMATILVALWAARTFAQEPLPRSELDQMRLMHVSGDPNITYYEACGDVNGDGHVTPLDVTYLVKVVFRGMPCE